MLVVYKTATVIVVAIAMALSLAHTLELPGKLRLNKEQYLAVQPIYYPGFTIGGIAEPLGMLMIFGLILLMPTGMGAFWLTVSAFAAVVAMHALYWLMTHPVNNFWLKDTELGHTGAGFSAPIRYGVVLRARSQTGPRCATAGSTLTFGARPSAC
ncbi:MAG TPA: DUF1772 domain-containing protein [Pseudolabrys sp.]|jgi:hypothetical protein